MDEQQTKPYSPSSEVLDIILGIPSLRERRHREEEIRRELRILVLLDLLSLLEIRGIYER